jgi:predicted nucleic-acid-binding protein
MIHSFALLNRVKILPGTKMEMLKGWKRGSKTMEAYPKKIVGEYTQQRFQSIANNFYPSICNPANRSRTNRTRYARRTRIQRIMVQRNQQDKEKKGDDTKCFISSHFWIELKFCLEQGWKGLEVENAVQKLWKCAPKRMLQNIRNNVFQSIANNFYPSLCNPANRGSCFRTRFARRTWIQKTKVQRNGQDKKKKGEDTKWFISSHFWMELKFCLEQGWKGWQAKRGPKTVEMCAKKNVAEYMQQRGSVNCK